MCVVVVSCIFKNARDGGNGALWTRARKQKASCRSSRVARASRTAAIRCDGLRPGARASVWRLHTKPKTITMCCGRGLPAFHGPTMRHLMVERLLLVSSRHAEINRVQCLQAGAVPPRQRLQKTISALEGNVSPLTLRSHGIRDPLMQHSARFAFVSPSYDGISRLLFSTARRNTRMPS